MAATRRFEGKVAIVTGGASGIGAATLRRLASEGARVICADIDDARGEQLTKEISRAGATARYARCDVGELANLESVVAYASAEVGVIFTGLTILAGSIWGKPTWGVWWTWDARLTTTAILLLIYIGYLMLRSFVEDRARGARYAAVLGIIGFLDIPLIHKSVEWWRTLHQPASVMRPGGSTVAAPMLLALLVSVAAFTLLYLYLLSQRVHLERLEAEILERNREG